MRRRKRLLYNRATRPAVGWHNIYAMRYLLVFIPALMLTVQAQTPAPAVKNASLKKVSDTKPPAAANTGGVASYKVSGSPTAPITIELYTDYECPACRNLYLYILPDLTKDFVATGKVRVIHRDFRIQSHQFTKIAARYANAAGEIGKFDIVANQLFVTQPDWAQNGNVDGDVAKALSPADMDKLRAVVKNDSHLDDSVVRDEAMAINVDHLTETPWIVIVSKGKREAIASVPYTILKQYLNQKLAQ